MRSAPPPTRYKVVERGRRLEVIDTWTGETPVRRVPREPVELGRPAVEPIARAEPPRLDSRGRRILTTRPWYDAKGPRRIVLTDAGEARLRSLWIVVAVALFIAAIFAFLFWPLLFVVPFILMREGVRTPLRRGTTAFIDRINDPA